MQEKDLSDNESMAMSVESLPYSPPYPSSISLKRSSPDVGLPIRKRRQVSPQRFTGQYPEKKITRPAKTSSSHRDVKDYHASHCSPVHMIEEPAAPAQALLAPSEVVSSELLWQRSRRFEGMYSESIERQMRRLHESMHEIQKSDSTAPRTWSTLQKRLKTLGQSLMSTHKGTSQELIQEARGLKLHAEAFVQYFRAEYELAAAASDGGQSSDSDSDADEIVAWKSRPLSSSATQATPDDNQRHKRRPPSADSHSEADSSSRQVSYTSTTPASASISSTSSTSIATQPEIEDFLSSLTENIHASTLQNLCPDNMRGTFCHNPTECYTQGRFFACPEYAILKKCIHEKSNGFTHFGYKHTINGCTAHHKIDCKRTHQDGQACRVQVVYFHVRASCITLRGGKICQMRPCEWGHDLERIRRAVMKR